MARKKKLQTVYVCACDLIFNTERQARDCAECGPKIAYLCPECGNPKTDYQAAERCCDKLAVK